MSVFTCGGCWKQVVAVRVEVVDFATGLLLRGVVWKKSCGRVVDDVDGKW